MGRKLCSPQNQWGKAVESGSRMTGGTVCKDALSPCAAANTDPERAIIPVRKNRSPHPDRRGLMQSACCKLASWLLCPHPRQWFYIPELRVGSCCCWQLEHSSEKVTSWSSWGYLSVPVVRVA